MIMASGDLCSINNRYNLMISCVFTKLIQDVPSVFHKNATASRRNNDAPFSRYKFMIRANSINTLGFVKSKSTWSCENVHHTCCKPCDVSVGLSNGLTRGRVTILVSSSGEAVMKKSWPLPDPAIKLVNH